MEVKPITGPDEFCRLCLTQHQIYHPLFETEGAQMLESLTSMKVSLDDPAPNVACSKCFFELTQAYNIQQRLVATETFLQRKFTGECETVIKHEPIKEEPIDVEPPKYKCGDVCSSNTQTDTLPKHCEDNDLHYSHTSTENEFPSRNLDELMKCRICPKEIPIHKYRDHRATHSDGFCEYCGATFKNLDSLRNHVLGFHREPKVPCDKCNLEFSNRGAYDLHVKRTHTGEATYICEACGRQFFTIQTLNKHVKNKHSDSEKFPCEVCGKNYTKRDLARHKLVHSDEMLFVCEFCGRGFKFKCNMNLHKTNVHGWKNAADYKCSNCGKGFSSSLALSTHMVIHRKNMYK